VKKLSVTLSNGAKPSIGTTLTPVKSAKAPSKNLPAKVTKAPAKSAKKPLKVDDVHLSDDPSVKRVAKRVHAAKKTPEKSVAPVKKAPTKATKKVSKASAPVLEPAVALRRGRHPVNPEADFTLFRAAHRLGSRVDGEVTAFTSHGAVIKVRLKGGQEIECYAPTTSLGDPAPARARDVLKRGDRRTFRLVTVDSERRIAELALL
jgi:hypothetical protein